jgi:glutamyl-tRNA synthetase
MDKLGGAFWLWAVSHYLRDIEPFTAVEIEPKLKAWCDNSPVKFKTVAQAIRVAVTGTAASPPIGATLEALGKERVMQRIDEAVEKYF